MSTNNTNDLIVKIKNPSYQSSKHMSRLVGTIDLPSIARIISYEVGNGLSANPRKSAIKTHGVVHAIMDTLDYTPEMMRYNSNGITVLAQDVHNIGDEGKRFNLTFNDAKHLGVVNGGHTLLGVALHILPQIPGINEESVSSAKIKDWDGLTKFWKTSVKTDNLTEFFEDYGKKVIRLRADGEFEENEIAIPVEVIYPNPRYLVEFEKYAYAISDAKNANTPLKKETKANQIGYYEILKETLDPFIAERVQWRDGDTVTKKPIRKVGDILGLMMLPLYKLQLENKLPKDVKMLSPIYCYNGKGKAIDLFRDTLDELCEQAGLDSMMTENLKKVVKEDSFVLSAHRIMKLIPSISDDIYQNLPVAYKEITKKDINEQQGVKKFSTRADTSTKEGKEKFVSSQPTTPYYGLDTTHVIPEGLMAPVVASIWNIMELRDNQLVWAVSNPREFVKDHLIELITPMVNSISGTSFSPTQVGKTEEYYSNIADKLKMILRIHQLEQ